MRQCDDLALEGKMVKPARKGQGGALLRVRFTEGLGITRA